MEVRNASEARDIIYFDGDRHVPEIALAWLLETPGIDSYFKGRESHRVTQVTSAPLAITREALGWSQRELARRMIDWTPPARSDGEREPPTAIHAKEGTVVQRLRRFEAGEIASLKVNDLDVARAVLIQAVARRVLAEPAAA
jgi:hypothetical protein